ncbi:hypothetical protein F4808DRAFT_427378 [Astrocystis sublimbata]|nr:hypothetical protein F4808DRAFT_427378 [Astrocystis sublimbata]
MATNTADFPLATDDPYAYSGPAPGAVDDNAGAAGDSPGAAQLSHGALIAIIVVVAGVVILGISTAVLFYLAKKKEWRVRENIRRSARKVVTALTPRRAEFPRSAKDSSARAARGRVRLDDVPPTPKLRSEDVEKGLAQAGYRQVSDARGKKWTRK